MAVAVWLFGFALPREPAIAVPSGPPAAKDRVEYLSRSDAARIRLLDRRLDEEKATFLGISILILAVGSVTVGRLKNER